MAKAVFYEHDYFEHDYFLLPREYDDFDQFKKAASAAPKPFFVRAVALLEDHEAYMTTVERGLCLAPFFLTGYHDDPSTIRIDDADGLYPAEVELLTQEEYNARLRPVAAAHCPGCLNFGRLTDEPQSLNGHFTEIALDGFCPYRVDSAPRPRCFRHILWQRMEVWRQRMLFRSGSAEDVCGEIKSALNLKLTDPVLSEDEAGKRLTVSAKGPLDRFVARALAALLYEHVDPLCRIDVRGESEKDLAAIGKMPEADFQKGCKRYGVSLLTLRYDPDGTGQVCSTIDAAYQYGFLHPLRLEDGCALCLALDTSNVLMHLHFCQPLLRTFHATAEVRGQYGMKKYLVDGAMPEIG